MGREGLVKAAFSALVGTVLMLTGILGGLYMAAVGNYCRSTGSVIDCRESLDAAQRLILFGLPLLGVGFLVAAYLRLRHELVEGQAAKV